ncbi:hypothetical protein DFJ74DRAFT_690944 [Hyaloraphidium curvatum]|nr:hypothetical protein DFJ74DRAFT_690944 [Hyaloraphidium curvatum]
MLHYSLLAALRKGILAECNDGLRSLWCSADRPEDFRAFACLSLPGLQFLSVALEASCLAEEDLRPGMVRVSFPALRRLVFRAGSELAFSDQLWRGLDAGAPALDVIELDLWSLGGEDRIDGIRNVPKRLRAAIAVLSVRDPVQISQIAKLGLHGFAPKKVSAMRHEDDDLDAFFKKPFDEAWKDLCAMERLTHFETSWFPSRAFDRGIPPRLKRIDAEVLCFDEAPSLERDRRIGGLQISAKKFELGGRPVGKYMARILRKNLW